MTKYCTLIDVTREIDKTGNSVTYDDTVIFNAIEAVSRRIDGLLQPNKRIAARPYFAPYIETRKIRYYDHQINSIEGTIDINQWFLELTSVVSGSVTITSDVTPYVNNYPPYKRLQLSSTTSKTWYTVCGQTDTRSYIKPLTINAKWGWHWDWDNAFTQLSTLNGGINATVTSVVVQTGDGASFSPGHFIKINDEYMEVTAVATDTLTVTRGKNGSTAAAHLDTDPVAALVIQEDIKRVTARQAASLYARRGAFEEMQFIEGTVVTYPQDLLQELVNTLATYAMDGMA